MEKRKVIWLRNAEIQMISIMDYYHSRNKSKNYSTKLYNEIKQKLKRINVTVALPQKTSVSNLFYFTHKHISVFFSIYPNEVVVKLVWDERRDPEDLEGILSSLSL